MRYLRISYTLDDRAPRYVGNPGNRVRPVAAMAAGRSCNTTEVTLFTHNGTHVDLPRHFVPDGRAVTDYAVGELVFHRPALLRVAVGDGEPITAAMLQAQAATLEGADLVFLKTGYCHQRAAEAYVQRNPYVTLEAARFLRGHRHVRAIGIDCISVANHRERDIGHAVHRELLGARDRDPVIIIEDVDLREEALIARCHRVFVIPLFVEGADSMPCTVFGEYADAGAAP